MKYYIVAGERSGDLHGSKLIKGIKNNDTNAEIRAIGGALMQQEGAIIDHNYNDLAFMGFWEVIKNIPKILRLISATSIEIKNWAADVVILIDYAGFNLRLAKKLQKQNIKIVYYISPKVWAWNQKRAFKIKALINRIYVIFPFEVDFYKKYLMEVQYFGNPLMDALDEHKYQDDFINQNNLSSKPIIAILPGSRVQEIKKMLPIMLESAFSFPDYQIVLGKVSNISEEIYEEFTQKYPQLKQVTDRAYDLLKVSSAAVVTSGTATLETALLGIPQVVCYKSSWLTAKIARIVIKVKYISLVNLILDKLAIQELIQEEFTVQNLSEELLMILPNGQKRNEIVEDYAILKSKMGKAGASESVGKDIVNYLR